MTQKVLSKGIILLIVSIIPVISTPVLQSVVGSIYGIAAETAKKAKGVVYDERTRTESTEKDELLDDLWWSDKEHSKEELENVYIKLYLSFLKDSSEKAKKIDYLEQKRSNYNFEWKPPTELVKDIMYLQYFFQFAVALVVKVITSFCVFLMDKTIRQENWEPLSEIDHACDLVFAHEFFKNNDWILDKKNRNNRENIFPETITFTNEKKEEITRQARICYGWRTEYKWDTGTEHKFVTTENKYLEVHLTTYKLHRFSTKATIFVLKRLDRNEYPLVGDIKAVLRKIGQTTTGSEEKRPSLFITRITVNLGATDVFNRWRFIDFVIKFITYLLPDIKPPLKNEQMDIEKLNTN